MVDEGLVAKVMLAMECADADDLRGQTGRLPWEDLIARHGSAAWLFATVGRRRIKASDEEARADGDETAMELINRAVREGVDGVFTLVPSQAHGMLFVQPITTFLAYGYRRALARFMEEGYDPLAALGELKQTGVQIARKVGTEETLEFLTSFERRKRIQEALDLLDAQPAGPQHV